MSSNGLITNSENILLNEQDEIQQILGRPPGWILRWGILVVFFSVIVFLTISWVIKYPDILEANITITSERPPVEIIAKASANLDSIVAGNQQGVYKGEVLAILESSANWEDVLLLEKEINKINNTSFTLVRKPKSLNLELGVLQNSSSNFSQNLENYLLLLSQDITAQKIETLSKEIIHIKELSTSIQNQEKLFQKELTLAKTNFERNKLLNKNKTISDLEFEKIEASYLQSQRQQESFQANIINNKITIERLKTQILDLERNQHVELKQQRSVLKEDLKKMSSEIAHWKLQYLLLSPIDGKVSFTKNWSTQQFISAGETIFTVLPKEENNTIIAKGALPFLGSGKVKKGTKAYIRLEAFPYKEFGTIEAEIHSIALVPNEEMYQIELALPKQLETTYNKAIPFRQKMFGSARIITEDKKLIERIFEQLTNLFKNR